MDTIGGRHFSCGITRRMEVSFSFYGYFFRRTVCQNWNFGPNSSFTSVGQKKDILRSVYSKEGKDLMDSESFMQDNGIPDMVKGHICST